MFEELAHEDIWAYEKIAYANGFSMIAGVDEAGRGPLAGPVVSAAVVLPPDFQAPGLTDSKKLAPEKREIFYSQIRSRAVAVGIGIVEPADIDRINILQAALLSMAIAVQNLDFKPDFLLIDGNLTIPQVTMADRIEQQAIVKGDCLSVSISAASVIAKVTRDRIMEKHHLEFPCYGFNQNKGYPTKKHREAIRAHGCCAIHRKTFKGVMPEMKTESQEYGATSETEAVKHLEKNGYRIVERNYRTKAGEIDIIAMDGETVVFVEVKARRTSGYNPKEAVTKSKQRRISTAALYYLKANRLLKAKARFDVVAIGSKNAPDGIEIVKNAFETAYR